MQMNGVQHIPAPPQRVWDALNDPEILRQCIPGCQTLEREPAERLSATVAIKIGPVGARFKGAVTLSQIDAPHGYTITGEGQGGTAGSAKGSAKVRLAADKDGTLLSYEVEAQVGGRLAQLGGPLIDATAKQLAAKFFQRFGEILAAPATGRSTSPAAMPSQAPAKTKLRLTGLLAVAAAATLAGFLAGRGQGGGVDWQGAVTGLVVAAVAAAGFGYGRLTAPAVVLDAALLARLRGENRS
jgi:uncharacterized protein